MQQVVEAILPPQDIARLGAPSGVIERQRKVHLGRLGRAMSIAAGTPGGAYQADVLRSHLECEVPRVARSAFSRWCDTPLDPLMPALAARALAYARTQQSDLTGIRGGVKEGSSGDSTTVRVRAARRDECPGRGDSAALKVPTVCSVGSPVSPAREQDSRQVPLDASWQGWGLLADLA